MASLQVQRSCAIWLVLGFCYIFTGRELGVADELRDGDWSDVVLVTTAWFGADPDESLERAVRLGSLQRATPHHLAHRRSLSRVLRQHVPQQHLDLGRTRRAGRQRWELRPAHPSLLCVHDPPVQLLLLGLVVSQDLAFERVHPVQQIIKCAPQGPDVQRSSAEFGFLVRRYYFPTLLVASTAESPNRSSCICRCLDSRGQWKLRSRSLLFRPSS